MTNYVTEAVAKLTNAKKIALGIGTAGVLAISAVPAANALTNNGQATDYLPVSSTRDQGTNSSNGRSNVAGTFRLDGGLQGNTTSMQGGSYRMGNDYTKASNTTSGQDSLQGGVSGGLNVIGQSMASRGDQTDTNGVNSNSERSVSTRSNGSADLGLNLNASAMEQSRTDSNVSNDTTDQATNESSQSGSLGLGLGLSLGVQGSSSSSTSGSDSYRSNLLSL